MNGRSRRTRRAALTAGLILFATGAEAAVAIPDCAPLDRWAVKIDRDAVWQPNAIGSRTKIPELFAAEETAALFQAPMTSWTENDVNAIRDAVNACRKGNKDKTQSRAYTAVQSALINRVVNFAEDLAQARPKIAAAMDALKAQPASLSLLSFHMALSQAVTAKGYSEAQRAAGKLPATASKAGRDLIGAMRELPQAEIVETIVTPSAATAKAMRTDVVQDLIADLKKVPASGSGLVALGRMAQMLPSDYGAALGAEHLKTAQQAVAERREGIAEEISTVLVTQIGQSSQGMDAFADIDLRANEAFLPNLPAAHATRVREAAAGRRQAVADILLRQTQAQLADLSSTDPSLRAIDQALAAYDAWPASAAPFKPRFQETAHARRAVILAAVTKAEAGSLRGRIYESENGRSKLEFVDRTRVFATRLGQTAAGAYTEEKDGRVVVTVNQQSWVLNREGRRLVGGDEPLSRTK